VILRESFHVDTPGKALVDVTARVDAVVKSSGVQDGLCTVFVHHTSASLLINENADPDVRRDLEAWLSRLVVDGDPIFRHTDEGPDDMSAHVRAALTATTLSIPVAGGRCDLGTWQAIYLWEHRSAPHKRRISVVVFS
jgi:secondary thiamine-phosphate synthase enzyme